MPITIVAATEAEILPTIRFLSGKGFDIQGNKFQLLITGVGMMAASYTIAKHIAHQKPQSMIQAGIAGSFSEQYPLLSTVLIKEEVLGDLGVEEAGEFKDIFDLQLADENNFPFRDKLLANPHINKWSKSGLEAVRAVTVNEISTKADRILQLKKRLAPAVESMEGAAFHYVCLQEKVPFLQVRTVSNYVGEREKKNWKLQDSIAILNDSLIQLIQESL